MNETENTKIYNPRNVMQAKRILGFKSKNWIEAGITVLCVALIVWQIPFVFRVKLIVTFCIGGALAVLNLLGLKNQSLSETAYSFIRYWQNRKSYSLRSVNYAKNNHYNEETGEISTVGTSVADKAFALAKNKIQEYRNKKE